MKNYDYKAAKKFIQMHSDVIESAELGMEEDWWWTADSVYEDNMFTKDLEQDDLDIAGIRGSRWATPVLFIEYKDGREEFKDCYVGNSDTERPEWFGLGCMSSDAQKWVDEVKTPKLTSGE